MKSMQSMVVCTGVQLQQLEHEYYQTSTGLENYLNTSLIRQFLSGKSMSWKK